MGGAIPRVYNSGRHVVASPLRNPRGVVREEKGCGQTGEDGAFG